METEPEPQPEPDYDSAPDDEEEELDPRIQSELERLNRASQDINNLELSLEDARSKFRATLNESSSKLDGLSKKLGNCVEKARPYYQARMNARTIQTETQKAALRYERACSMHAAAKEMVNVAEQGFLAKGQQFDTAWQEMLNHATTKVNEAETEIMESELEHAKMTYIFHESEQKVKKLHREHKRSVNKSRPYFELKGEFNRIMEEQKKKVGKITEDLKIQKTIYSCALKTLERISDEIHAERAKRKARQALGQRVSGVGAEDPDPSPEELRASDVTLTNDLDLSKIDVSDSGNNEESSSSMDKTIVENKPTEVPTEVEKPEKPAQTEHIDTPKRQEPEIKKSSRYSQSPAKDSSSLILSVGSLSQSYPSLPYAKVTPTKTKKDNTTTEKHNAEETLSIDSSGKVHSSTTKETDVARDTTVAKDTAVAKDTISRDTVSSEDVLDTDSDTSSVHVPDDDMVADALNDFTDEDFLQDEPKFQTLPANLNFSDLKSYFKQGDLKKWSDQDDLH